MKEKTIKEKAKGFALGMLSAAVLAGMATGAAGDKISKTAELFYNDIKICIDGSYIEPKDANGNQVAPFIMDGTTYLPVRAVAGAFGKDVEWDADTQTVFLGAKPGDNKYSRTNPAPIGTAQSIALTTSDSNWETVTYNATVTLNEVWRGEEAAKILKEANDFWNDDPEEGKEYVLAKVTVGVKNVSKDMAISISEGKFDFYSTDFVKYNNTSFLVMPEKASINTNIYDGGSVTGYIAKEINAGDSTPSVAFGQEYDGTGGIWFSLTK